MYLQFFRLQNRIKIIIIITLDNNNNNCTYSMRVYDLRD